MWSNIGRLSDNHITYLNDYYDYKKNNLDMENWLHVSGVKKLMLTSTDDPNILECGFDIYDMINNKNLVPYVSYILEYYEGSFTTFHKDNVKQNNIITTVTLIHQSNNLNGGKALFRDEDKSITVLDQKVGDVLCYGSHVDHGVSKVVNGARRVLINWFKQKEIILDD